MADYFSILCPVCGRALRIPGEYRGQSVHCKYCSEVFVAPVEGESPVPLNATPRAGESTQTSRTSGDLIRFRCPKCTKKHKMPRFAFGNVIACSKCSHSFLPRVDPAGEVTFAEDVSEGTPSPSGPSAPARERQMPLPMDIGPEARPDDFPKLYEEPSRPEGEATGTVDLGVVRAKEASSDPGRRHDEARAVADQPSDEKQSDPPRAELDRVREAHRLEVTRLKSQLKNLQAKRSAEVERLRREVESGKASLAVSLGRLDELTRIARTDRDDTRREVEAKWEGRQAEWFAVSNRNEAEIIELRTRLQERDDDLVADRRSRAEVVAQLSDRLKVLESDRGALLDRYDSLEAVHATLVESYQALEREYAALVPAHAAEVRRLTASWDFERAEIERSNAALLVDVERKCRAEVERLARERSELEQASMDLLAESEQKGRAEVERLAVERAELERSSATPPRGGGAQGSRRGRTPYPRQQGEAGEDGPPALARPPTPEGPVRSREGRRGRVRQRH